MLELKPGITCRVVDHPKWVNPVKKMIIGCCVVLIHRVHAPHSAYTTTGYGWQVSGLPPAYVVARRQQNEDFKGHLSEDILEPLPPIDLTDDEEVNQKETSHA